MTKKYPGFKRCCNNTLIVAVVYDVTGRSEDDQKLLLCQEHWEKTDVFGNKIYQQDIKNREEMSDGSPYLHRS